MILKASEELIKAVKRCQAGDQSAFDTVYYESIKYVTKCVLNVLNRTSPEASEDLQQDILQETYLTIASKLDTLQNPEAFLQWAGQIATHHAQRTWNKDVRQNQMEQPEDEMVYELVDEDFIPEDILQNKEKQRMIRQILEELPTNQYLCVVEYFYNGLKETEVAEKLGMPVNTVKTNLLRAKKKLRGAIETKEKKDGIRLHSMAWLLWLLFREDLLNMVTSPARDAAVLEAVHGQLGAAAVSAGTAATGTGLAAKIVAAVLAGTVVIGGAVGIAGRISNSPVSTELPATTVSSPEGNEAVHTEPPINADNTAYREYTYTVAVEGEIPLPLTHSLVAVDNSTGQVVLDQTFESNPTTIRLPDGDYTLTVSVENCIAEEKNLLLNGDVSEEDSLFTLTRELRFFDADTLEQFSEAINIIPIDYSAEPYDYWDITYDGANGDQEQYLQRLQTALWNALLYRVYLQSPYSDVSACSANDAAYFLASLFQAAPENLEEVIKEDSDRLTYDGTYIQGMWYPSDNYNFTSLLMIEQLNAGNIRIHAVKGVSYSSGDYRYREYMVVTAFENRDSYLGYTFSSIYSFPLDEYELEIQEADIAEGLYAVRGEPDFEIPSPHSEPKLLTAEEAVYYAEEYWGLEHGYYNGTVVEGTGIDVYEEGTNSDGVPYYKFRWWYVDEEDGLLHSVDFVHISKIDGAVVSPE